METSSDALSNGTVYARAKHVFSGKNNDELSFEVGEMIAVSQQLDGGWWEGTLNGETGWFPSAYVSIVSDKDKLLRSKSVPSTSAAAISSPGGMNGDATSFSTAKLKFIEEVLKDLLTSENQYIRTIKTLVEEYLDPLSKSDVLTTEEFSRVEGGICEIYGLQANVYMRIEDTKSQEPSQQRVGGILLSSAPLLKDLLVSYCSNHPDAVAVISAKSDALTAFFASKNGQLKTFIQGLSEPFRHLSKYPTSLQELHRNMIDSHPDRGDVQRSCAVYRDLKELCESVRRQRELQLDFLAAPRISRFQSEEGRGQKVLRVGTAMVAVGEQQQEDRFLALFSSSLLLLELSPDASDYTVISSLSTQRIRVKRMAGKQELVIMGGAEEWTLEFSSSFDLDQWITAFEQAGMAVEAELNGKAPPIEVKRRQRKESAEDVLAGLDATLASQKVESVLRRNSKQSSARRIKSPLDDSLPFRVDHELEMILPDSFEGEEERPRQSNDSAFYLRNYPPYRVIGSTIDTGKKGVKMRKDQQHPIGEQGDAELLAIIEGYLGATRGEEDFRGRYRHDAPQLIVADDEKLLVEEVIDGHTVVTEKSLVDVVYALKDQMDNMVKEMADLRALVDKEQRARRRLEDSIKRSSLHLSTSTPKPILDNSN